MTLAAFLPSNKINGKSLWNQGLVFLFIATFFLDGVTRYKHAIEILMLITTLVYFIKNPMTYVQIFKNYIFYSIALLSVALLYSVFISPDIAVSFKEFNNTVLKGFLAFTIIIPVLLKEESRETIAKLILFGLIASLCLRSTAELMLYYQDYTQGVLPFSNYNHRHISDSLVFLLPALLNIWLFKSHKYRLIFIFISCIYLFLLLGTLSRGAWLAVLIVSLLWVILNRQWQLLTVGALICVVTVAILTLHKQPAGSKLLYKLQQTDSSNRYDNGTQGSALSLILENPIKGYGYGDDIYHNVYNSRIVDYPNWVQKRSIGPHNILLYIWFGAGIAGVTALIYVYGAILTATIRKSVHNFEASPYNINLMMLLSLVGFFLIRGNFEQVELDRIGIITSLLIAYKK